MTVLQAGADERAPLIDHLTDLLGGDDDLTPSEMGLVRGPAEFFDAAREAALRRIEEHERIRGELTSRLRRARELEAVTANRRDEAAARVRRMSAHLDDCDALLQQAGELTNAAEEARRTLEERRADVEAAHAKLGLVEEQRAAAAQMIEDASHQLRYLEAAELDETALRRELEAAGQELRAAEAAQAEANDALRAIEQAAAGRAAAREHVLYERNELAARVESPMPDTGRLRRALEAFDAEAEVDEPDLVARELAREWDEVDAELSRIEAALPTPPSPEELEAAERRLDAIESTIVELEAASHQAALGPDARDEIEAAHEAVLAAEEQLDQAPDYDAAVAQLQQARDIEQSVLQRHGYETYLDVILSGPAPEGEDHAELMDALRARRVAEETLAQLRAAAEPPAIVTALRVRRDRIHREATELLGVDPGDNVAELLHAHPVVPPARVRELVDALGELGVTPVGVSVREAAEAVLAEQEQELAEREECRREIERLDRELVALDEEDARAAEQAQRVMENVQATAHDVEVASDKVQLYESEMVDRASQDERRLQRIAAAEQLRSQITAVTDALDRSNEEYHAALAQAEADVIASESAVQHATNALAEAVRKLRRISDALPPALRPRPGDDPLAELPRLHETLAAEVERAEVALADAEEEHQQATRDIEESQAALDAHLEVTPTEDIGEDDLVAAVGDLVGAGETPVVLDDPFAEVSESRDRLLDELVACTEQRPVVLLTDDPDVLGWAIGLPPELGTVTRLAVPDRTDRTSGDSPIGAQPRPVG
ncbi:MAG TPA: hypothetical protein VIL48_00155 [Acidimicrobiales bacterium]